MKRHPVGVMVVCAALAALATAPLILRAVAPQRKGPARYELDRMSHNWGQVAPGSPVSTTFSIRNVGGSALSFGEPKASCGCTKPVLPDGVLRPGERTELLVNFHVPMNPGTVRHFVTVPTNAPDQPPIELTVFATSWIGVCAVPQTLDTGRLRPGDRFEGVLQVYAPDNKPYRVTYVSSDLREVRVESDDKSAAASVHRIRVRYEAGQGLGHVRGSVRV